MDIHQTEEQQVEAIKSFWSENGNAIIAGLAIGLAGFVGFNYYKDSQLQAELMTADAYQTVIADAETNKAAFVAAGESFISNHEGSSYAAMTAMALAKEAAEQKDWARVETHLNTAIAKSTDNSIKAIATIRLARVQLQLEKYDQALASLAAQLPASFKSSIEEIKGDIFLKQGKTELARTAYQAAVDNAGEAGNVVLQMKLDDLAQAINLN